ncbi:hypothetical protein B0T19DRAFT_46073 [Cercophora scortea]|uniref:Uncharacterized protein n=1 Tax=Cercophora scortea TaxID=314031 RepID=A0AAE0J4C4_9PEZI|nr:hypothetical protein B0T19DRAFT_46073 [Cercophora scortea]
MCPPFSFFPFPSPFFSCPRHRGSGLAAPPVLVPLEAVDHARRLPCLRVLALLLFASLILEVPKSGLPMYVIRQITSNGFGRSMFMLQGFLFLCGFFASVQSHRHLGPT